MKILLIGVTGATGSDLPQLLLNDGEIESVEIFVRRDPQIQHTKLTVNRIDFERPEQWSHRVKGNILFSCLGSTLKDAGSRQHNGRLISMFLVRQLCIPNGYFLPFP